MSDEMKDVRSDVLFLGPDVLCEDLDAVLRLELTDEARIPKLTGDSEVLTAAHEGVALARLSRGGDAVRVEVLLLSSGDANKPEFQNPDQYRDCFRCRGRAPTDPGRLRRILCLRPSVRHSSHCEAQGPTRQARRPCSARGGT